jgi:tRNA(adenine34) deaminase
MAKSLLNDTYFMKEALKEARLAFQEDEIPVGAVIVCQNTVIAKAHNLTEKLNDATAHAEIQAFTAASDYLGGKYLTGCTLYVTLEPCVMCAGAAFWTQIGKIVYGASDEKRGFSTIIQPVIHPKTKVVSGILENECSELLKQFFISKRAGKDF